MADVAATLRAATAKLQRVRLTEDEAREVITWADGWIDGLGSRRNSPGFRDEYREVAEALEELRELFGQMFRKRVLALSVPRSLSRKHKQIPQSHMFANALAATDYRTRSGEADPGYIQAQRSPKPSVEVELVGCGTAWVTMPTQGYRARPRDVWALIVNGKKAAEGSRWYCMRQADWVLMCDPSGTLPEIEVMRGLAKRRALHKQRKALRAEAASRARKRERFKRRIPNWMRKLGAAMADSVWRSINRPSMFEKMLTREQTLADIRFAVRRFRAESARPPAFDAVLGEDQAFTRGGLKKKP